VDHAIHVYIFENMFSSVGRVQLYSDFIFFSFALSCKYRIPEPMFYWLRPKIERCNNLYFYIFYYFGTGRAI
jgi:hypothetical protein